MIIFSFLRYLYYSIFTVVRDGGQYKDRYNNRWCAYLYNRKNAIKAAKTMINSTNNKNCSYLKYCIKISSHSSTE